MPELNRLATSAASNDVSTVQAAIYSYFHQLEKMWGNEGNLTTIQRCNANNCANSVPDQLCRYINLRTFLKFALLPHASPARGLTATKINDLLESLEREKRKPGKSWHLVAQIWKEVRHEIESNKLDLRIKPRFARGDINFIGHGAPPLHKNPAIALRSPAMLKHIIRELALPGWESRADRLKNLGIVAVEVPSAGLRLFRPTILDNFGLFSYFFLPGLRSELSGLTWPLTGNLRFNSGRRYDGQQEWTVLVKPKGRSLGLSCVQTVAGKSSPTFQIAGLAFGDAYGQLFKE